MSSDECPCIHLPIARLAVREGILIVKPSQRLRGGHDLSKLVSRIPKRSRLTELNWGRESPSLLRAAHFCFQPPGFAGG